MTIPYLPGWGDNLAQSLPQLGNGIAHIVNPQMDQQMALKMAMIKDPSILQHYASVERDNPGTLERLGFGRKFGNIVGSIQESDDEILNKQKKKADINKTLAETGETTARTTLTNSQNRLVTAQSQLADLTLSDAQRDNQQKIDLFKAIPDLANKDINKIASDFAIGKIDDPKTLARIQADRQYGPVFDFIVKTKIENAKLALDRDKMNKLDRNDRMIAVRYALSNQREAEQRLTSLETLQRKYGSMDQKNLGIARQLAAAKPDSPMAQELAQYDQMVSSGGAEVESARKDVEKAKALTEGSFRAAPEFRKILSDIDAKNAAKQKEIDDSLTPKNQNINDPAVGHFREAINTAGLDAVKQSPMWKKLSPSQQKAAQTPLTMDPNVVSSPDTEATPQGTPDVSSGDNTRNATIKKNKELFALPGKAIGAVVRGLGNMASPVPGTSGGEIPVATSPYEDLVLQAQDAIKGKPIGSYYKPPTGQVPQPPIAQGRLPITSPNFDTPIQGVDSATLLNRLGLQPGMNPQIRP